MDVRVIRALVGELAPAIREYAAASVAPALDRIALLERQLASLPAPRDGASLVADAMPLLVLELDKVVARLPAPAPGKDADPVEVERLVAERVDKAIAALPPAKDGDDGEDGEDADPEVTRQLVADAVASLDLPTRKDIADATQAIEAVKAELKAETGRLGEAIAQAGEQASAQADENRQAIAPLVAAEVGKAVAALPPPRNGDDGKSITPADVADIISGEVTKAVAALPKPKDGVGVAGAVIDRSGALILTLTDGATRDLGVVVGKDVDQAAVAAAIREEVAKIPRPSDGADGLGFDDLSVTHDGERGIALRFVRGDQVKEFPLTIPAMIYRGVHKDGASYQRGDTVTWAGSGWVAERDTASKPGDPDSGWRLAVKAGRPGKDGDPGKAGDPGKKGDPGRDLTQVGPSGNKW